MFNDHLLIRSDDGIGWRPPGGSYSNHKILLPNSMGHDLMSCLLNNLFSFVFVLYEFMKVMLIELCNQEQFSEFIIIIYSHTQ